MIVQLVKFESGLTYEEAVRVAREREAAYRAVPGLIQKIYIRFGASNTYGGFMIWESAEALAAFRQTDLARTVPEVYATVGAPEVMVGETMFLLREADRLIPA